MRILTTALTLLATTLGPIGTSAALPGLVPTFAGEGIRNGPAGKLLPFGTPRASATRQLADTFGKPLSTRTIPDCGQGEPMTEVRYRGGVRITYFHSKFSGWDLDDKGRLKTDRGIANGATRAALKKAYPSVSVDDGSLGVTFDTDDGIMGYLSADRPNARVTGLFAGETCKVS